MHMDIASCFFENLYSEDEALRFASKRQTKHGLVVIMINFCLSLESSTQHLMEMST